MSIPLAVIVAGHRAGHRSGHRGRRRGALAIVGSERGIRRLTLIFKPIADPVAAGGGRWPETSFAR